MMMIPIPTMALNIETTMINPVASVMESEVVEEGGETVATLI